MGRCEQGSCGDQFVERGCLRDLTAHKPEVFVVVIVGDEQHDVRLFCCFCRSAGQHQAQRSQDTKSENG